MGYGEFTQGQDEIATRIAPKFGVSAEEIGKRLRVEKLWPPEQSKELI